jgi:hypothetical protein
MTKKMEEAYVKSVENSDIIDSADESSTKAAVAAGEAMKEVIIDRFSNNGKKDVSFKKLSPEYIKAKGNNRIGYNTGDLYRDIHSAQVNVKRTK